ncbi:hypothetical protein FGO68_gene15496 [Halteria grandinella]|uniref:Uncharacterized protein n=1 Tax=Halteria grandinella TaxID=5974 RepID=A0A8J8P4F3_HALGN|nr:hypothetical protein FGO68_gene15496 [Halteria grandinella]
MSEATSEEVTIPRLKFDLRAQSQPKLRTPNQSFLLTVQQTDFQKPQIISGAYALAAPPETAKVSPRNKISLTQTNFYSQREVATLEPPKPIQIQPLSILKQTPKIAPIEHQTLIIRPEQTELFKQTPQESQHQVSQKSSKKKSSMFRKAGSTVVKQRKRELEELEEEMVRERRMKEMQLYLHRQASSVMEYEITDRASNLSPMASNKGSATKVRDAAEHFAYKSSPVRRDLGTGLERAPFLMQFKGGNSIHEGDREKASSILKNLVYMPARDLGKFQVHIQQNFERKIFPGDRQGPHERT